MKKQKYAELLEKGDVPAALECLQQVFYNPPPPSCPPLPPPPPVRAHLVRASVHTQCANGFTSCIVKVL